MSNAIDAAIHVTAAGIALDAGQAEEAKRQANAALVSADDQARDVLNGCTTRLLDQPQRALSDMHAAARDAETNGTAALVAACIPDRGEYRNRPEAQPQHSQTPTYSAAARARAARDNPTRTDPAARRTRDEQRRIGTQQPPMDVVHFFAYLADLDRSEEIREMPEETPGYAHDYDRAANRPLRGDPCVFCWLERAPHEVYNTDRYRAGYGDDGLCGECRECGYSAGIPPLRPGHGRAAAVMARCAYLADRHPLNALSTIAREWQRGRRCPDPRHCDPATCTRHIIEKWISTHRQRIDEAAARAAYDTQLRAIAASHATADLAPAVPIDHLPACRLCHSARFRAADLVPGRNRDDRLCSACRGDAAWNANEQHYREQFTAPLAA